MSGLLIARDHLVNSVGFVVHILFSVTTKMCVRSGKEYGCERNADYGLVGYARAAA